MELPISTVPTGTKFSLLDLPKSYFNITVLLLLLLVGLRAHAQSVKLSTTSLNFSNQVVGTTSKVKSITLMNTGTAMLSISGMITTGDFAQTNTCGSSLPPSRKCLISVTFTPTVTGVESGSVVITDNAPDTPQTVTLTGTGVSPVVLTPTSAQFPGRTVGTTSAALNFTLKNNLTNAITITSISASGDFAQSNACGSSLGAGAKCIISVTFTPTQTGTRTGSLSVYDTANNSPQTATLSGTGTTVGLISIAVAPANPTIAVGSTLQFTATGTFNTGFTYDLTKSVVWSSTSISVATVSNTSGSQGLATAVAAGTTTIKAIAGKTTGSTGLTVTPTLVSISVTPSGASIPAGETQQFTATGTYSDGSTTDLTSSATWSSSAPNVASISNTGLATGVSAGSTTITASSGSIFGCTPLIVTAPALVSISVSPGSASIPAGGTQQFSATGTYSDGSAQNLTTTATWSSSDSGVATVNASGLASGVQEGTTSITALSAGIMGTATLTVTGMVNLWTQDPSPVGPPVRCLVTAPSGHVLALRSRYRGIRLG